MNGDFTQLCEYAGRFRSRVLQVKQQLGPLDFEWYPYDSFSAFAHLDRLLTGSARFLFSGKKTILDIGCQDGEIAFCLESAGHEVVALDHPVYNHNCMRGVRALKEALGSDVELHEVDVDRQFQLPKRTYDIAVLLGVLYHLRNPFYILDELARRSTYCLLSTRIARCFPDGTPIPPGASMAYLLGERELNYDETNYFIYSETGLRTLFQRTYWDLCAHISVGNTVDSDPVRPDRDERIFCLLKSRFGQLANVEFLTGWHQPEESGWRWTQREFSARIQWNSRKQPRRLMVELFLSELLMSEVSPLRLSVSVNGSALTPEVYRSMGPQTLIRPLKKQVTDEYVLTFSLSGVLAPTSEDGRERGVVISSIRLE